MVWPLFIALILSLPWMQLAVAPPVLLTDLLFLALLVACAVATIRGKQRFRWRRVYWVPIVYVASLVPSIASSTDLEASAIKLAGTLYLVALAVLADQLARNENDLRRAILAWLSATAVVVALGIAALLMFIFDPGHPLVRQALFHFGTLPPGPYPRLAVTFVNANMLCNYLTVSLAMVWAAHHRAWLPRPVILALAAGILIVAVATLSPGIGGFLLAMGIFGWIDWKEERAGLARILAAAGIVGASVVCVALTVTPIIHPTAPYLIFVPGIDATLAPSGRLMVWMAAVGEFAASPWIGHGIGIDAVAVRYQSPSGADQLLTDAHNVILNIAAQAGTVGLVGLGLLIWQAVHLTRAPLHPTRQVDRVRLALGIGFLNAFVYQGLGGSFEDARHLWLCLGLLYAASRIGRPASAQRDTRGSLQEED